MPLSFKVRRPDGRVTIETVSITEALFAPRPKKSNTAAKTISLSKPLNKPADSKPSPKPTTTSKPGGNFSSSKPNNDTSTKPSLTPAETTQLKALKSETGKSAKSWKQISEIMKRDVEDLKSCWRDINTSGDAAGGTDAKENKTAEAGKVDEEKKEGNGNEGSKKGGKGGGKQKEIDEEKKAAALAAKAKNQNTNENNSNTSAAAGPSGTNAAAGKKNQQKKEPTDTKAKAKAAPEAEDDGEQESPEALIRRLATKAPKDHNRYVHIKSRYFDITGRRVSEGEIGGVCGELRG